MLHKIKIYIFLNFLIQIEIIIIIIKNFSELFFIIINLAGLLT